MKRRNFIQTVAGAVAASAVPLNAVSFSNMCNSIIKPPRLKKGDTIGLISPGSDIKEKELSESITNLEKLGFKVKPGKNVLAKYGYLGGTDKERSDDINEMFADKEVNGIVCTRGGYGCGRLLPYLNYDLIKENPKVLIGYSDITSLLYGIFAKTGLVCFHGPVGISTYNDYSTSCFVDTLMNKNDYLALFNAAETNNDKAYNTVTIKDGIGRGRLVGGNLSLVVSVMGTPYDIDLKDKILFLEEIGEEPYRIDRMLTQLLISGNLEKAKGIALGVFNNCDIKKDNPEFSNSLSLIDVLKDRLSSLNIPIVYGMSFGHITNKMTLPFGVEAELNTHEQSLTFLESPVL